MAPGSTDRPGRPEADTPQEMPQTAPSDVVDPSFREAAPTAMPDRAGPIDHQSGEIPVPETPDTLPGGADTIVVGDPKRFAENCHQQGTGEYQGTCGIASCEQVLQQFDHADASEKELVEHAAANGLCETAGTPEQKGATSPRDRCQILNDFGEPAHLQTIESPGEVRSLVEDGRGVIVRTNAGELWNDASAYDHGQYNHAVSVTGVAVDPETGSTQGFFINDTGTGEGGQFVEADRFQRACFDSDPYQDNQAVVTERRWPDVGKVHGNHG